MRIENQAYAAWRKKVLHCRRCSNLEVGTDGCVPGTSVDTQLWLKAYAKVKPIFLLGQSPGTTEVQKGIPFIGQAGEILEAVLARAGLNRSMVWIDNVVRCHPPGNRANTTKEMLDCHRFTVEVLGISKPAIVV